MGRAQPEYILHVTRSRSVKNVADTKLVAEMNFVYLLSADVL